MSHLFGMDFSDKNHVIHTFFMVQIFAIIYVLSYKISLKKVCSNDPQYACRFVTFFHGLIDCLACLFYIVLPSLGFYKATSIPYTLIIAHSLGYFVFDIFWCFIHDESPLVKFHHIVTVSGLTCYLFKPSKQFFVVYALGITEVTSPILQVRWVLKYKGLRDTLAFKVVEPLMVFMFFYMRLVVLSYYLYETWFNEELKFDAQDLTFMTLGTIVGYALSYQMLSYIIYQIRKSPKSREKLW